MTLLHHHAGACLLPPRLTPSDDYGVARFLVGVFSRDLIFTGYVTRDDVRAVVHAYAAGVSTEAAGFGAADADAVLDEEWDKRVAELADPPAQGDEVGFARAVDFLTSYGVAVRDGIDCCRDGGIGQVESEHQPGARHFAVWGLLDLLKVARAARIDIRFSYLDDGVVDVLTPELSALANAGDDDARALWLATSDSEETIAGMTASKVMREVGGLDVEWNGTPHDSVHVHVPRWRRALPV